MSWLDDVERVLALPRSEQSDGFRQVRAGLPPAHSAELWNTRFGAQSLFDAWTSSSVMRALYAANAEVLATHLRPGFTAVEVGGGDGKLWRLLDGLQGTLHVVDPVLEAHERVRDSVPGAVEIVSHVCGVESAELPAADVVVCSLTLHHLAGRDADERSRHGLAGSGKLEALRAMRAAAPLLVLNEADVHCDVALASGSDALLDHMIDSYLRRAARSLIRDQRDASGDLADRLEAVVRHFCLEQLDLAAVPVADRDVYELDVAHWLELLDAAGFSDVQHRYTDDEHLFVQYLAR
ncbi:MAG: class I SAM-dependent methyltransferase [Deltaproteobacteria bacterium]|nr:MAG: class I SAM-dependent methyltransferase [Deltaproteobacteria bacterium]